MPAQQQAPEVTYFSEGDTDTRDFFLDDGTTDANGDPNPLDLTLAGSVTIEVGYQTGSQYYAPRAKIIDGFVCSIIDAPNGIIRFAPATVILGTFVNGALTPPGEFEFNFIVHWLDGTQKTVPPNTFNPMIIRTPVGGKLGTQATP